MLVCYNFLYMPKISVIIPIYNIEKYVDRCLESISNQDFLDFEAICVNDGSTDNSKDIINKYVQNDSRFVLLNKENGGLSDARNYGVQFAKGDYIFFLDGDDYIESNCLNELYKYVELYKHDLVMCGYNEVNYDGSINRIVTNKASTLYADIVKENNIINKYPHCAWNKLYSIKFFKELGIKYPKGLYYEDVGTTPLIYLEAKNIAYINKPLINYVVNRPGNITTSVNKKIVDILDNLRIVNDYYINKQRFDEFKNQLCYFNLDMIFDNLYKVKSIEDKQIANDFIDNSYALLDKYFDNWKSNDFFNKYSILKKQLLKNKELYRKFIYGK